MKKICLILLLFLCACSNNSIPSLNRIKNYSSDEINKCLMGVQHDKIFHAWGEPDDMCSGLYCDFYYYEKDKAIILYYDEYDCVEEILIELSR